MDHMLISGNGPSSVILNQKCIFKNWKDVPNVPKQAEAKRDGVNKTTKLQFGTILRLTNLQYPKHLVDL